jgi:hypothetical protein
LTIDCPKRRPWTSVRPRGKADPNIDHHTQNEESGTKVKTIDKIAALPNKMGEFAAKSPMKPNGRSKNCSTYS